MVAGQNYSEIGKWLSRQKIDRPSESKRPAPTTSSRALANARRWIKDQEEDPDAAPAFAGAGGAYSRPADPAEAGDSVIARKPTVEVVN